MSDSHVIQGPITLKSTEYLSALQLGSPLLTITPAGEVIGDARDTYDQMPENEPCRPIALAIAKLQDRIEELEAGQR